MSYKRAITALTVFSLILLLSVLPSAEVSADLQDEVSISTINGDDIIIDLESNGSKIVEVYVINNSDEYLGIECDVSDFGENIEIEEEMSTRILYPQNDDGTNVEVITLTVSADAYVRTSTMKGTLTIKITDLNDTTEKFSHEIPIQLNITSSYTSGDAYNKFFGIVPNTLDYPLDSVWLTTGVTFVLWVILTMIISAVVAPVVIRLVGEKMPENDTKTLVGQLIKSIVVVMLIIAINQCVQILGAGTEVCYFISTVSGILYVLIGAFVAWKVYNFVIAILMKGLESKAYMEGIDSSLTPLLKMIGMVLIGIVAVFSMLSALGVDLAGILVSAGVVTLGITLGAQNVLNQFFCGVILLTTRPFKEGDFVSINGTTYIVRKVRLMNTDFYNWDKDQVITFPNSTVSGSAITNFTKETPITRVFIFTSVPYGTDLEKAKAALLRAANRHPHVISNASFSGPATRLTNFLDSGIEFRLACFVDDYNNSANYAGQIREMVIEELASENIFIPFNRVEIDILSDPRSREA